MKLIDKDAVIDAIERLIDTTMDEVDENGIFHNEHAKSVFNLLCELEDVIYNLEAKEVDLEKEIKEEYLKRRCYGGRDNMLVILNEPQFNKIAKHFFELGVRTTHPITANDIGIEAHIISLLDEWRFLSSTEAKYRCEAYAELLEWIYTRLKEPAFGNQEEVAKHFSKHCINQTQKEKQ